MINCLKEVAFTNNLDRDNTVSFLTEVFLEDNNFKYIIWKLDIVSNHKEYIKVKYHSLLYLHLFQYF